MTYFARPDQKSTHQKQTQTFNNLTVFNTHLKKQLTVHQQIFKNYSQKLSQLQQKKNHLLTLIQQSIQKNSPQQPIQGHAEIQKDKRISNNSSRDQFQSAKKIDKMRIKSTHLSSEKNASLLRTKGMPSKDKYKKLKGDESLLVNRSRVESKKQKQKSQTNYLSNMNEYKHKDLVQEVTSLMKQLNNLVNKSLVSKDLLTMGKSTLMQKSSAFIENKSLVIQNKSLLMESKYCINKDQKVGQSPQQQFTRKYLSQVGCIQKLPSVNPNDPSDEVISSLIANLQKQQSLLMSKIFKYRHLQIQKIIKQNLHEKTVSNMRTIYNLNKQKQSKINKKQLKSTKDLIKFGYTDQMLLCIQQKTKNFPVYH